MESGKGVESMMRERSLKGTDYQQSKEQRRLEVEVSR